MPLRSNPLASFNQSQSIADAISNVGNIFNPVSTMQMGLLQAKQREIDANIANQEKELGLKAPVYAGQAAQAQASAGSQNALRDKYTAETKGIVRQQNAQDGLGTAVSAAYGLSPEVGHAIKQVAIASNDSNSKQIGDMIANLGRLNPQTGNPGENIFWAPGDWRMPTSATTTQSSAPVGVGTAVRGGATTVGNVTTVPSAKSPAIAPANPYVPFSTSSDAEKAAYNKWVSENQGGKAAQLLSDLKKMEEYVSGPNAAYQGFLGSVLTKLPFLGNTRTQQFDADSKVAAANARTEPGSVSNFEQQLFLQRVPNPSRSPDANKSMIEAGVQGAKKTIETSNFIQKFVASGGSLSQAERIVNEYNLDPMSRAVEETKNGGVMVKPHVKIEDWYAKKLANPGRPLGTSSDLASVVSGGSPQNSSQLTPEEQAELMARRARAAASQGYQTGGGF